MTAVIDHQITAWQERVTTSVQVAGEGPPVLFLHGEAGLVWDPFLDALALTHTVYAPCHPGTDGEHPDAVREITGVYDLVVFYAELLDRLALGPVTVVGHSFGGMVAAELAATYPERVTRLVLLNPVGLWRDDAPVANWMALPADAVVRATFADPDGPLAKLALATMADVARQPEVAARYIWSLACTGKFVWPIPDRGLARRIHRIAAPTLLIWGRSDDIVPSSYAEDFAGRIATARLEIIEGAGHLPHVEQTERVVELIRDFLDGR